MMQDDCLYYIRDTLGRSSRNEIFCVADFMGYGTYDAVRKALSRLSQNGFIERIVTGVYWVKPGEDAVPPYHAVAEALARNYDWKIALGTNLARAELGLIQEPPRIKHYLCTGRGATYSFYGQTLKFQHCDYRIIERLKPKSMLVASALMYRKDDPITAEEIMQLSTILSEEEKIDLQKDRIYVPARIRCVFDIICGQYGASNR